MNENNSNDLQTIITQVIEEMKSEQGDKFDPNKINLAEMGRRTGLTRAQLRRIKANGFLVVPHALTGRKAVSTIISGYTGVIDDLLKKNVSNSEVILERIQEQGYTGSLTTVKRYISEHKDLIPPKRQAVAPQGNRGRRYTSDAGESYQMDWGFVNVDTDNNTSYKVACFAMICHHCGERYIEFFPNAKQENLFIGMIHAFKRMGVPDHVLTDNMKTVMDEPRTEYSKGKVNGRFQHFASDYGFVVKPCIAGRPQTKAKVEAPMKLLDEIYAYNGLLDYQELNELVQRLNERINHQVHPGTGRIPVMYLQKERAHLLPLPKDTIRKPCQLVTITSKVNISSMITYHSNQYSVPPEYIGKTLNLQVYDNHLHVYYNTTLVAVHAISSKKLNYLEQHYIAISEITLKNRNCDINAIARENLKQIGVLFQNE